MAKFATRVHHPTDAIAWENRVKKARYTKNTDISTAKNAPARALGNIFHKVTSGDFSGFRKIFRTSK